MLGNANHTASVCTVKTAEDTKGGQKGHLERNVLGIIKKREIKIIQRTHFSPTPATVESSQLILHLYKKKKCLLREAPHISPEVQVKMAPKEPSQSPSPPSSWVFKILCLFMRLQRWFLVIYPFHEAVGKREVNKHRVRFMLA